MFVLVVNIEKGMMLFRVGTFLSLDPDVVVLDCGIWIKFYLGVYGNKRTLFLEKLCCYGRLSWSFIAWLSAIFIKCLFWKNYVLGSEVIKCINILGSIDFSFPISEPWLLSSRRRRRNFLMFEYVKRKGYESYSSVSSAHIWLNKLPTHWLCNCFSDLKDVFGAF